MKKNLIFALAIGFLGITSNVSFAGLIDVSKIVITPSNLNTSGWLQVSEVIATATGTGNDLALLSVGATTAASSNWSGSSSNNAIDGVSPAAFPSIFHSNENNGTSFLNIFLASPSELDSIELFGRTDCCWARDIYDVDLFDVQGSLLYSASDLNATGGTHSVKIELPNTAVNVPEPSSIALLAMGLIGFGFARKKSNCNLNN